MVQTRSSLQCEWKSALWVLLSSRVHGVKIHTELKSTVCVVSISKRNRFMLNPSKSELMCCVCSFWTELIGISAVILCDGTVNVFPTILNLRGCLITYFDEILSISEHIIQLVRSSAFELLSTASYQIYLMLSDDHSSYWTWESLYYHKCQLSQQHLC